MSAIFFFWSNFIWWCLLHYFIIFAELGSEKYVLFLTRNLLLRQCVNLWRYHFSWSIFISSLHILKLVFLDLRSYLFVLLMLLLQSYVATNRVWHGFSMNWDSRFGSLPLLYFFIIYYAFVVEDWSSRLFNMMLLFYHRHSRLNWNWLSHHLLHQSVCPVTLNLLLSATQPL